MFMNQGSVVDRSRIPSPAAPLPPLRFSRGDRPSDTFSVDASNALDSEVPGLLGDDREESLERIVSAVLEAMKATEVWRWLEEKQAAEGQKDSHLNRQWQEMSDHINDDPEEDLDYVGDEPPDGELSDEWDEEAE